MMCLIALRLRCACSCCAHRCHTSHIADMNSECKYAVFQFEKTKVDILDALFKVVRQYDVEGTLSGGGASAQGTVAAMAVSSPHHGVNMINNKSGEITFKFRLPKGKDARVALSKDTLTVGVGSNTGVMMMMMMMCCCCRCCCCCCSSSYPFRPRVHFEGQR